MEEDEIILNNNIKMRYLESKGGRTSDRHILFIHGLGSSADRWLDIPDALSNYYNTIAVDLIGFGKSEKPADVNYTIEKFAEFILDFITKLRKKKKLNHDDGKITLVGHSLGGYIAVEIAIRNIKLIEKLVLIDSSGFLEGPTPLLEQYLYAAKYTSYDNVRNVFEQMVSQPWRISPVLINTFITTINSPGAKYPFESAYKNSTTTQIDLSRLKSIEDIPTLIIWGIKDNLIPIEHSNKFKQVLKKCKIEKIEDAGHAPFAEKPAIICEMLHTFLSQNN
ncbi:MAG TPA: alpha/beta hydrolase [Nitrososphaeraceae archaeon]|nr:alpha/beta hydrolase [Nitrososphaeraceae archaeon]HET8792719.1 alpha/beta hydrolase [Nitrososphaeraceae archaeon]